MSTRLVPTFYQAIDGSGNPLNGALIYFYETGTTTLKDTYSDTALTVLNANPAVADSDGRFGDIFGALKDDYKAILKDASDNLIESEDPVDLSTSNINSFDPRPYQHWGTTTNTADAYRIKPDPSITAYSSGLRFSISAHLDNNASCTFSVFEEGTVGDYLSALDMKKLDGAGAKIALEASDMQAGQTYDIFIDTTDAIVLNPQKPYLDLINTTKATTSVQGINYLDKFWLWGFIPTSGADPDEETTITVGKGLCEDGSTIIELTATATDLNWATVLGGALGNATTYHLYRYLKDDDTMQWHLETSLTPTIADIKSAGAFRRIVSLITDNSGDLYPFVGLLLAGGGLDIGYAGTGVVDYSDSAEPLTYTDVIIRVPLGLRLKTNMVVSLLTATATRIMTVKELPTGKEIIAVTSKAQDQFNPLSIYVETTRKIQIKIDTTGDVSANTITTHGFIDNRNYY